jgi:hypothetical protein
LRGHDDANKAVSTPRSNTNDSDTAKPQFRLSLADAPLSSRATPALSAYIAAANLSELALPGTNVSFFSCCSVVDIIDAPPQRRR